MKQLLHKNHLLYLAMLSFLFISSSALAISRHNLKHSSQVVIPKIKSKTFPSIPRLTDSKYFPTVSAQGVIAIDLDSGVSLYEKNADAPLLPASTTKIITALVALDTYPANAILTVYKGANVEGQKMGLFPGEQMLAGDLIYGLLVYSANDAAMTLAQNYPGGYESFVEAMNAKAKSLFMNNSVFENPVGLDSNYQRSTARDLVRAAEVAMRNTEFAKIVATNEITVSDITGKYIYPLKNLNQLLGTVPGVIGIKTGWTESARENLVTFVNRDNHKIVITLLGSQDRFGETKELIDWIFANYDWQIVKYP